jgi:hypothetical protein
MKYMLLPLDQHADGGLGATGEAFQEAAKALSAQAETMGSSPIHLPINFLYRHAIELFLKSMIVVLHRELGVDYGDKPHDGSAFVSIGGTWKPLHRVHSVAALWAHARELLSSHADELSARCRTDWQAIPDGLDAAIAAIEEADGTSTYFRYPDARRPEGDAAKSSWNVVGHPKLTLLGHRKLTHPGARGSFGQQELTHLRRWVGQSMGEVLSPEDGLHGSCRRHSSQGVDRRSANSRCRAAVGIVAQYDPPLRPSEGGAGAEDRSGRAAIPGT